MTREEERDLVDAFSVHAALVAAEAEHPHLKASPRWQLIRMDAYAEFYEAMTGASHG